jgi:hypothetical protein
MSKQTSAFCQGTLSRMRVILGLIKHFRDLGKE